MPSGLFSPKIATLGERCANCAGEACDSLLGGQVTVQQALTLDQAETPGVDITAEFNSSRSWTLVEFLRMGCTLEVGQLDSLIAVVCGDEEVRGYANSVLGTTVGLIEPDKDY